MVLYVRWYSDLAGILCILIGVLVVLGVVPIPLSLYGGYPELMIVLAKKDNLGFVTGFKELAYNGDVLLADNWYRYIEICVLPEHVDKTLYGLKQNTIPGDNELTQVSTLPEDTMMEDYLNEKGYYNYKCYSIELDTSDTTRYGIKVVIPGVTSLYGYIQVLAQEPQYNIQVTVNGKTWSGEIITLDPNSILEVNLVIDGNIYVSIVRFTLIRHRQIIEQSVYDINQQAPVQISWKTQDNLQPGTYTLKIVAMLNAELKEVARITINTAGTQTTIREIVGIIITAVGAIIIAYPRIKNIP